MRPSGCDSLDPTQRGTSRGRWTNVGTGVSAPQAPPRQWNFSDDEDPRHQAPRVVLARLMSSKLATEGSKSKRGSRIIAQC